MKEEKEKKKNNEKEVNQEHFNISFFPRGCKSHLRRKIEEDKEMKEERGKTKTKEE